jgi:hypothetical protein
MAGAVHLVCLELTAAAATGFHVRDGDTVVRHSKVAVRFVHSGWGGDRLTGGGGLTGGVPLRAGRAAPARNGVRIRICKG